jgi:hypothetical protein
MTLHWRNPACQLTVSIVRAAAIPLCYPGLQVAQQQKAHILYLAQLAC